MQDPRQLFVRHVRSGHFNNVRFLKPGPISIMKANSDSFNFIGYEMGYILLFPTSSGGFSTQPLGGRRLYCRHGGCKIVMKLLPMDA